MTDEELNGRLNYLQGVGWASMLCLQQLVRVIQERKVLSTSDLRDVFSEAVATIKVSEPPTENEAAVSVVALATVERYFADPN